MSGWNMICGGYYYHDDGRKIVRRRNHGQAPRWYIVPYGYEHPDWEHPYPTLKAAQEAAG